MKATSVMFLVNALGFGGAELQVYRLAIGMKRRGWQVTVVTLVPPVALADELREQGIEVQTLNMRPGRPNPLAAVRLLKLIRARRPRVVHSHIVHANLLARLVRPLAGIPVLICTAHSIIEGNRWLELAYRCTDRLNDLTTNVSQAGLERYVRIGAAPADRIRFVPNGLDLGDFKRDPLSRARLRRELEVEDRFVWLAAGRLTEAKDYANLLTAFASLPNNAARKAPVLLIAGRGNLEKQTHALAASLALGDRVRFLGLRGDVPALMNAADAYVMSSAWEGMPLVLQEASATELPVVATDVGGTGEVIVRDHSGFLVPSKDSTALAAAMRGVMSMTDDSRATMGQAGRAHMQSQFGLEAVLDTWEKLYDELLRDRGRSGGPRRVMLVVESSAAGTGRHVLDLADGLSTRGCDVHLLYSPLRMDALFAERLSHLAGIQQVALPMQRRIHPSDLAAAWAIRKYLFEHGPFDVIHGHSSKGGALARLAALGTGCAVVYTPHGLILNEPNLSASKRLMYRIIEVGLSEWTSKVIAVSPEERRLAVAAGIAPSRLATVPNGVRPFRSASRSDARRAIGLCEEAFVFGSVGRLIEGKAVDMLLDAFAPIAMHWPAARLVVVGAGPCAAALRQRAEQLRVDSQVLWLGERDSGEVYPALDVFAIASRKEGLPYVVIEAMAAGLPVISTDSAGVEILIKHGVSGTVVPRDDVKAFAKAMLDLVGDPERVARYGQAARERAALFTVGAMVDGVTREYAMVAGSRAAAPPEVEFVRGDALRGLLAEPVFLKQWNSLHERCPWGTAFQSHGFVTAWYSTYVGTFEPLLLISRAKDGLLQGLLALAISNADGSLVVAGRQQAEYHTWLCTPALGERFPLDAIRTLRRAMPGATLTFHYLAPGTPTAWLATREARRLCLIKPHHRPLLRFGDGREIIQTLKKSSNKSRLKRLEKLGGLEFRKVTDPAEFEALFDSIVRLYDFRHGAVQGSDPFCTLDRQKAFHVAMMKTPGLLHVTVMKVGDKLAAAHWGAAGKREVQLGTIVHDPFLAKHSPGKFQILLLSRMLIEEGYEQFDLTPGGDAYKNRFTNASDEVHTLTILPTRGAQARMRAIWRVKDFTKTTLGRFGLTTTQAKCLLRRLRRPAPLAFALLGRAREWVCSRQEIRMYVREVQLQPSERAPRRVQRNAIHDLLEYEPGSGGESRQAFLGDALARIEGGQQVFTIAESGRLRAYAWVDHEPDSSASAGTALGFPRPPHSAVISKVQCVFESGDEAVYSDLLHSILQDLARAPGVRHLFLEVPMRRPEMCTAAECLGFSHVYSLTGITRFGNRRFETTEHRAAPPRSESSQNEAVVPSDRQTLQTTPAI